MIVVIFQGGGMVLALLWLLFKNVERFVTPPSASTNFFNSQSEGIWRNEDWMDLEVGKKNKKKSFSWKIVVSFF